MIVVFRILLAIFALALIFFGAIMTISPVPLGFIFVLLGLFLLAAALPAFFRWMRKHWRWLDRIMDRLEKRLPEFMAKHLRATDYNHDEDEDEDSED